MSFIKKLTKQDASWVERYTNLISLPKEKLEEMFGISRGDVKRIFSTYLNIETDKVRVKDIAKWNKKYPNHAVEITIYTSGIVGKSYSKASLLQPINE